MIADSYLKKNNRQPLISVPPEPDCGIIVVIPCYREPEILQTLESLNRCETPECGVEVIILINHSEIAESEVKRFNAQTKREIENWIAKNKNPRIRFFTVGPVELPNKWAGAGLARKAGMDEATGRFNFLEKPPGIIVSLDADTLVEKNYLIAIENYFKMHPRSVGATIAFEHRKEGLEQRHREGIRLYEKYLVYYKTALEFTGFPHSMYTIGSAFAVRADAYVKRGGMNRRQAGEDFYFLHGLVQLGAVGNIETTRVFPSARISDRVPFGTGPVLQKWMNGEDNLTKTYNFDAFADLRIFFSSIDDLFKRDEKSLERLVKSLPPPVAAFLREDNFSREIIELNKNCSTLLAFRKRFFQKFDAFKILKFLNFSHERFYRKANLNVQMERLEMALKAWGSSF